MSSSQGAAPAAGPQPKLLLTDTGRHILFGVVFTIMAEFLLSMGYIQMKMSHQTEANRIASESSVKKKLIRNVMIRPRWWLAISLLALNTVFNLLSYSFASLTVLAPTSCISILINVILARLYFDEKLTDRGCLSTFAIIIGCVISLLSGDHTGAEVNGRIDATELSKLFTQHRTFGVFAIVHLVIVCLCLFIGASWTTQATSHSTNQSRNTTKQHFSLTTDEEYNNYRKVNAHSSHYSSTGITDLIRSPMMNIRDEGVKMDELSNSDADFERMYRGGAAFDEEYELVLNGDGNKETAMIGEVDTGDNEIEKVVMGHSHGIIAAGPTTKSLMSNTGIVYDESGEGCYDLITTLTSSSPMCMSEFTAYILRGVSFAFATAGVIVWLQLVCKAILTLISSIYKGDMPLNRSDIWILLLVSVVLIGLEIHLISEMMRIFDAILIVPLFSSVLIMEQLVLTQCYFHDLNELSVLRIAMFGVGLVTILIGIFELTRAHGSISLARYKDSKVRLSEARTERSKYSGNTTTDDNQNHENDGGLAQFGEPEWSSCDEDSWDISISEADDHFDLLNKIYG